MAHQYDEKITLLRNLISRLEQNDKSGLYSLRGIITRAEYDAFDAAFIALRNLNSGTLVEAK